MYTNKQHREVGGLIFYNQNTNTGSPHIIVGGLPKIAASTKEAVVEVRH